MSKPHVGASVVVIIVLVGALAAAVGYFAGVSSSHPSTTTSTSYVTTTQTPILNNEVFLMKVNGSFYWADDVSKDTVVGNPGYSYFRNASITFDGVRFQTICAPIYSGCPVPEGTTITQETVLFKEAPSLLL